MGTMKDIGVKEMKLSQLTNHAFDGRFVAPLAAWNLPDRSEQKLDSLTSSKVAAYERPNILNASHGLSDKVFTLNYKAISV